MDPNFTLNKSLWSCWNLSGTSVSLHSVLWTSTTSRVQVLVRTCCCIHSFIFSRFACCCFMTDFKGGRFLKKGSSGCRGLFWSFKWAVNVLEPDDEAANSWSPLTRVKPHYLHVVACVCVEEETVSPDSLTSRWWPLTFKILLALEKGEERSSVAAIWTWSSRTTVRRMRRGGGAATDVTGSPQSSAEWPWCAAAWRRSRCKWPCRRPRSAGSLRRRRQGGGAETRGCTEIYPLRIK